MVFCKQRARAPEDKAQRRADLLQAAERAFAKSGGVLPSVAEVGKEAGVSKATVYLYFETKEDLYLALHEEGLRHWLSQVVQAARNASGTNRVRNIVADLCAQLLQNPGFLRLTALTASILEHNVSEERALAYKQAVAKGLLASVSEVQKAFPKVEPRRVASLFTRSYALILGLWQMAEPAPVVRKVIAEHRELGFFKIDFGKELREALELLWAQTLEA